MIAIYKLTNRVTGMSYIGITTQPIANRCAGHRKVSGHGSPYPLHAAIREYGWDAFDVAVLAHAQDKHDAAMKERAAIALYGTLAPTGYNVTPGGPGSGSPSLATREKLREHGKRQFANGRVLVCPPEARKKAGESRRGARNWGARPLYFNGRTYDCIEAAVADTGLSRHQIIRRINVHGLGRWLTESKRPSLKGRVNVGRKASPEARRKMSEARSGAKHYRARAIEIDGVVYPSITDASKQSGYSYMQLKTRLKDGRAKYLTASRYIQ